MVLQDSFREGVVLQNNYSLVAALPESSSTVNIKLRYCKITTIRFQYCKTVSSSTAGLVNAVLQESYI